MERARRGDGADTLWRPGLRWLAALLLCAIVLSGFRPQFLRDRQTLFAAQIDVPTSGSAREIAAVPRGMAAAEDCLAAAAEREAQGLESCVDFYYRAAIVAWQQLESVPMTPDDPASLAAWQIYQQSLARLVATACRYGRLDPRGHLVIADASGRRMVPIVYYGFPWKPHEFCHVASADEFRSDDIARHYQTSGLGTSLVAIRQSCGDEPHYPPRQHFPVTAVLRPAHCAHAPIDGSVPSDARGCDAVLEFYNPCLFDSLRVGPTVIGMQRDVTAPLACLLEDTPRKFTEGFLDPGDASVKPRLYMMEPYQRGKIPVVFIHGVWSDPVTWVDAVNELRAHGDIYRQYQFWFFGYPTGRGLLESAAELREKLLLARERFDPTHQDPAMDQMVLVGHSMGGIVAQLQSTYSYDILWRHAARQPLESVRTTPAIRERMRRMFYFDPSPSVSRVVYIGTPNRGSTSSRRLVGRLVSSLVRMSEPEETQYRQLMDNNRDIFAEYLWDSWPTSIDLLEPSNPMLQALASMPLSRRVRRHTIIGTGGMALGEPGDGVVSVSSARQAGVCSELLVPVRHEKLHRDAITANELLRILREHARESG